MVKKKHIATPLWDMFTPRVKKQYVKHFREHKYCLSSAHNKEWIQDECPPLTILCMQETRSNFRVERCCYVCSDRYECKGYKCGKRNTYKDSTDEHPISTIYFKLIDPSPYPCPLRVSAKDIIKLARGTEPKDVLDKDETKKLFKVFKRIESDDRY